MMSTLVLCLSVAALTAGPSSGVAGKWDLSVDSPHGNVAMTLTLVQDARVVKGHLVTPHGDQRPVAGEFADGRLTLATTDDQPEMSLVGKLGEDGTLKGHLSSAMGDMPWTAARVKGH
jgi:hypothetical protein